MFQLGLQKNTSLDMTLVLNLCIKIAKSCKPIPNIFQVSLKESGSLLGVSEMAVGNTTYLSIPQDSDTFNHHEMVTGRRRMGGHWQKDSPDHHLMEASATIDTSDQPWMTADSTTPDICEEVCAHHAKKTS